MLHKQHGMGLPALLVAVALHLSASAVIADQAFMVTTRADSGVGTLRWALTQPCEGTRSITFGFQEAAIELESSLVVTGATVISGIPNNITGTNGFRITISGGGLVRPFAVAPGASLRLENLTLANGSSVEGGAIYNEGSLRVVRSTLLNNTATRGGAIYNKGTAVLKSCTLSGNNAARGGALYNAGGSATLQYVTASENSAAELGGVIYTAGGTQMVHRSILWGNLAPACATPPAYSTQIADANSATVSVTQTIIEGGYPGYYDPAGLSVLPGGRIMTDNLDADPLLAPLNYPPYPYTSSTPVSYLTSTKAYFLLPGSPATLPNWGYTDRFAGEDDGTDQRGSDDRSHVQGSDLGSLFAARAYPTELGGSGTTIYGEVRSETNTTQSAAILTAFKPIRFTVTSFLYPPPHTFAGGKVFFRTPDGTASPSCTFEPNPATIAADNTVTVTPVANGYVGDYTVTAMTQFHAPFDETGFDTLVLQLHNDGAPQVTVTNDADDGFGSLRWATENVAPGGLVKFDGDYTIRLATHLEVFSSIDGETNQIVISGDQRTPVMDVRDSATIQNVTIADGLCTYRGFGGGVRLLGGDVNFENVVFRNNRGIDGGAIAFDSLIAPYPLHLNLINCLFLGNSADESGGAICATETDGEVQVLNCTFTGNMAQYGGAINNLSVGITDGLHETFANCIFSDNTASQYPVIHTTRLLADNSVAFRNCNVQGAFPSGVWDATLGTNGGGNIAANPLFTNVANNNFSLLAGSPSINAGHNGSVPTNITKDLAGLPRISDGTVDMGAYETPVMVAVTFHGNGGTPATVSSNYIEGVAIDAFPSVTRAGYTFSAWTNTAGGTVETTTLVVRTMTNLYARWTANGYTVAYNGNGSTDGTTASSSHTYGTASPLTLYGFARLGFAFAGWNTADDGSGTAYADGASVLNLTTVNALTVTLHAQWVEVNMGPPSVGTGADGLLLVSGTNAVDSVKTKLSSNGVRGQTVISVASATGFGADDEILIICMQGSGAGTYEFATVASAATGLLTLNSALQNSFTVAGGARVMVQRVPNYLDVTVRSNGVLTASAWAGGAESWTPGGVVAFRAKRTLTIEAGGRVTADALGFAGGTGVVSASQANGYQGESYSLNVGVQSREPNNGGGGGGLYFSTTGDGGGGGGGGGHGTAGMAGANVEPYHGLGGTPYGNTNMTTLFLGSGGGAGGSDDDGAGSSKGGDGGRGGGIVYIAAHTLVIEGGLSVAGGKGETVQDTDGDAGDESGGGGGGAGGTVVLASAVRPSLTASALVPGGSGGGVESGLMLGGTGGTGIVAFAEMDIGLWSDAAYRDTGFTVDRTVISNAAQLAQFAWIVNSGETYLGRTVMLAGDIDLAAHHWVPAGPGFFGRFEGAFDGAGQTVRNIRAERPDTDYQGLFGCVGADGVVRDLTVTNATITGNTYVGGVAGRSFGTLSNCTVRGSSLVVGTSYSVGGVVGCAEGALVDCTNGADVTGLGAVGGVAGEANGPTSRCRNSGTIHATGSVGGVAGLARGALSDCSNSGTVESSEGETAGGVAAYAESSLYRCFNSGSVEGSIKVGGITADHYGERIDGCVNTGEITGNWAAGIATSAQSLVQNCANNGQVIGLYAGGIVEDLRSGGVVRNCANSGEVGGFSSAGGLVRYVEEEALLENGVNSGAVMATDNKAGGLAYRNRGVVTNSYWKMTGVEPFTTPAVWTNSATLAVCESFGSAPGTLVSPVTVGGVTTNRLSTALNAWVAASWTPGCGLSRWTAGSATTYPSLAPAVEVGGAVIPQTLSDRFMIGVASVQVPPVMTLYTSEHPTVTATALGDLLSQADAMGFTFAELSTSEALLAFKPSLSLTDFDPSTWTLTFAVANGIDGTATEAMNRLADSTAGLVGVLQMAQPKGAAQSLNTTVEFHGDGTATATFDLPAPPTEAFFRLILEHRP